MVKNMKINQILPSVVLLSLLFILCPVSGEDVELIGGDMGTYRVHCNVEGARVYFDSELMGEIKDGILDVPVYITGTPYRNYTVEKEGYRTYTGPINSVPAKGEIVHIYVTLSAKPPVEYGRIHVLATPAGSEVTLDNTPAGKVDVSGILIIYDVLPGEHTVMVSKDGYVPNTSYVYVGANDIVKLPVTLAPVAYGTISVNSAPAGAGVYLDDRYMGVSPIVLNEVTLGTHTVMLDLSGYQPYSISVQVTGDAPAEVNANLVGVPTTAPGRAPLGLIPIAGALAVSLLLAGRKFR
jgi:hypothetical protein